MNEINMNEIHDKSCRKCERNFIPANLPFAGEYLARCHGL